MAEQASSIVIVGRPNVGKSTLFNRLTGTRRSIVTDEPGITRDRIYGTLDWEGRALEVVDTGGIVPDEKAAIPREILRQAEVAIEKAGVLILVVDVRAGVTPLDEELARLLRRTGKPLFIAANKVDTQQQEAQSAVFYRLGKQVFPVSAEHGAGMEDLLDAVVETLRPAAPSSEPATPREVPSHRNSEEKTAQEKPVEVAIIGRPNVGKSTLLNRLAGEERAIVSAEPGTTRDSVDTDVVRNGRLYRFVDTAGIRRKGKTKQVAEKLSVVMARRSLERADVALLVVDAELGVTASDATIAGYAEQSGRSVIIVMNKWDLAMAAARGAAERAKNSASGERTSRNAEYQTRSRDRSQKNSEPVRSAEQRLIEDYQELVRAKLKFLSYAPIVFLSAKTGDRIEKLYSWIDQVAAERRRRISTGELNRWLAEVDLQRGTSPLSRRIKIFYVTQASSSPPTFVLFTNQTQRLHFSFERFLENRLREVFQFTGAPIRFLQRMKEKRGGRHAPSREANSGASRRPQTGAGRRPRGHQARKPGGPPRPKSGSNSSSNRSSNAPPGSRPDSKNRSRRSRRYKH
jgi:GTP-binding protein